jgi:hypothetical protein
MATKTTRRSTKSTTKQPTEPEPKPHPRAEVAAEIMTNLGHAPDGRWRKGYGCYTWYLRCDTCGKQAEVENDGHIGGQGIDEPCHPKTLEDAIKRIEELEDSEREAKGAAESAEGELAKALDEIPTMESILDVVDMCQACRNQPMAALYRCAVCQELLRIAASCNR